MQPVQDLRTRGPLHQRVPRPASLLPPVLLPLPFTPQPRVLFIIAGSATLPAPIVQSGNTLLLTAESPLPPDPVALAVTCGSDDGEERVVNLPEDTCK